MFKIKYLKNNNNKNDSKPLLSRPVPFIALFRKFSYLTPIINNASYIKHLRVIISPLKKNLGLRYHTHTSMEAKTKAAKSTTALLYRDNSSIRD